MAEESQKTVVLEVMSETRLDLNELQDLDAKTIHTVYGFIRQIEAELSISIPSGLIVVFVLFYGDRIDKFDGKCIGSHITINQILLPYLKI